MAVTASLVYAGNNRLRYLVHATGSGSVTLTTTGAATPDLLTDTLAGPLKNIAKAFTNGYGQLAAGALTQAQARAIWMSDDAAHAVAVASNLNVPTAQLRLTPRSAAAWSVDANVDGSGHPTIVVTADGAADAYLDVIVPGAIG